MKKKEINVPERTSEVPLKRYQKLMSADPEQQKDFRFIFSCLTGCDESDIDFIKARDMDRAANALVKALNDTDAPIVKMVQIGGVEYGLEPELNNLTMGMLADIMSAFDEVETWSKAVAILYRPIIRKTNALGGLYAIEKHQFDSDAYKERQQIFSDGPASLYIGLRSFFLRGSIALNLFSQSLNQAQSKIQSKKRARK